MTEEEKLALFVELETARNELSAMVLTGSVRELKVLDARLLIAGDKVDSEGLYDEFMDWERNRPQPDTVVQDITNAIAGFINDDIYPGDLRYNIVLGAIAMKYDVSFGTIERHFMAALTAVAQLMDAESH